jgi:hypothetical protein
MCAIPGATATTQVARHNRWPDGPLRSIVGRFYIRTVQEGEQIRKFMTQML